MNYEIGARIGDYEVLAILGAGGMGRVYKVRNTISDRVEAMKVLLPNLEGDPELADRFVREIKVQAKLDHPNIASLHTALRVENQLLMLMEYVEGVTLEELMKRGRIPIEKAVDYLAQVLSALSYAHGHGVIHRDLKPANMILTPQGAIKLMDFGIAKLTADRKLTQTGRTVGSLFYMSPEQIKGAVDLDPRSDLYSLGISLYEIATGARPFEGDSEYTIMAAHLETNPVPPITLDPTLPPALSDLVLTAIAKDPAKRFQTADAFRNALLSILPGRAPSASPQPARPPAAPAAPPPVASPAGSRRGLYIAVGSLVTVIALVGAALVVQRYARTRADAGPEPGTVSEQAPAAPKAQQPVAVDAPQPAVAPPEPAPARAATPASSQTPAPPRQSPSPPPAVQITAQPAQQVSAPPPQKAAAPPPQQAAAPPADAATQSNVLDELREQLMLLGIRATAVKQSVESIRQQQARMGLGLRQDMAAGLQRMEYQLDETEAALKRGDAASAKRSLGAAEREVSKLEGFMGR
jgi:serine/threonine-protein kinase